MTELRDSIVQLMPLILAVLALLIPTAAERMKNKSAADKTSVPVVQGQTVDFGAVYVESVKERDARQEAEIERLKAALAKCTCGAGRMPL